MERITSRRTLRGCSAAVVQASRPPQSWPTTTASRSPSARTSAATSADSVGRSYPRGGLSLAPYPRRSGATTWKPAAARSVSCVRQVHQNCGKPCSSRTSGPSPVSAACRRTPLAEMSRCVHGPGSRTLVASGRPPGRTVTRRCRSDGGGLAAAQRDPPVAHRGPLTVAFTRRLPVDDLGQVAEGLDGPFRLLDLLHPADAEEGSEGREQHQQSPHDQVGQPAREAERRQRLGQGDEDEDAREEQQRTRGAEEAQADAGAL